MSSRSSEEGDVTIIKSKVTVSQTEVTETRTEAAASKKGIDDVILTDISKVGKGALKSLGGFRTFILRGNVVDLAIGIVIGAAFTSVVTSLVGDVITPIIPLPGKNSLGNLNIPLPPIYPKGSVIHIGAFINAIISFLIVAAVLYFFVVQPVNKLMSLYHPKEAEAKETRTCPYCFQAVNIKATRCPFCTSHLAAENGHHEEQEPVLILPESLEKLSEQLAEKIVRKATTKLEAAAAAEAGAAEKE
jgi:large conductance mechanosensitive channel